MDYRFTDLVDIDAFRSMLASFLEATGIPLRLVDTDNNAVSAAGWQDSLATFHLGCACDNGPLDYATPIVVEGRQLATLYCGQVFHEPSDLERLQQQAQACGYAAEAYLEAIRKVPVIPKERVAPTMAFYLQLTEMLAKSGLDRLHQRDFRSLAENIPDNVARWDTAGRYLYLNPTHQRTICAAVDDMIGRPIFDAHQMVKAAHAKVVATGQAVQAVKQPVVIAGVTKLHDVSLVPEFDADGRMVSVLGIGRDMTDFYRLQETIATREQEFRSLAESSPNFIIRYARDGRMLYLNGQLADLLGVVATDVIGKLPTDVWPGGRYARLEEAILQTFATGMPTKVEFLLPVNTAERYFHLVHVVPEWDAAGQLIGAIAFGQDITELRQAEEQNRQLSQAVEQSPESVVITDLDGCIQYVNDAFLRETGYARDEVIGQNPRFLHSGKTPQESFVALWDALTNGRVWQGELYNQRKDGSEYVELAIISPMRDADGKITHYVAVKENITERKRQAQELDAHRYHLEELVEQRTHELTEAKAAAEAANIAKSAFLANMSHEIRTPLNAITGMAHLIRRGGLRPTQEVQVEKLNSAAAHLLEVINAILDLSKIEAGRFVLEEVPIRVESLLANVVSMLQDQAHAKQLWLTSEAQVLPANLLGDPTRLQQAILNYAGNAIKFTESGGVTIKAALTAEDADSATLRISVSDTGIGIAPEQLDRLFTAFEQADNSTTRHYGGTGLGLAITRKLAQLMGGESGAQSIPGQGSTFWLSVRLKKQKAASSVRTAETLVETDSAAEAMLKRKHTGRRVLLAEDEPINREIAQMLMEEAGLAVDVAENGLVALELAAAEQYDLILMDMQMPGMDGLEATRRIRALPQGGEVSIVAMTANAFADDRARCMAVGMDDFITKPVVPERLYACLWQWLEKKQNSLMRGS